MAEINQLLVIMLHTPQHANNQKTHTLPFLFHRYFYMPHMLQHIKILLFTFITALAPYSLFSQALDSWVYTTEDGLPASQVWEIMEAENGTIWVGTAKGICWFDSYQFHQLHLDEEKSVYSIITDKKGTIWAGTHSGIFSYNIEKGGDSLYRLPIKYEEAPSLYITKLALGKHDNLWFSSSLGISRYSLSKNKTEQFLINKEDPQNEQVNMVHDICFAPDSSALFVASRAKGLLQFDIKTQTYSTILDYETTGMMNKLYIQGDSVLWVGSFENGLFKYSINTGEYKQYSFQKGELPSNRILSIIANKNGVIAGTDGGGLVHIHNNQNIEFINKETSNISNNKIYATYQDRYNNLWLGHYKGGLSFISALPKKFIAVPFEKHSILNHELVTGIIIDSKNNQWLANDAGGLIKITPDGTRTSYKEELTEKFNEGFDAVLCVAEDHNGNILAGTYRGGLCIIKDGGSEIVNLTHNPTDTTSIPSNSIWDIYIDKNKKVWIATHGGGGCRLDNTYKAELHLYSEHRANRKIKSDWCWNMVDDDKGNLWINHTEGISVYNMTDDSTTHINIQQFSFTDLHSNSICELNNGTICIAGNDSIYTYNPQTKQFIPEPFSLNGLDPQAIIHDGEDIWISGTKGLIQYNFISQAGIFFDKSDGLPSTQFLINSAFKTNKGELYFGGTKGFIHFNPNQIILNKYIPEVIISGLYLFDEQIYPQKNNSPLLKDINYSSNITLTHKQNIFSFQFSALNYIHPANNNYKYKLHGFDTEWVDSKKSPVAHYMNLPPGDYEFQVIASNNDDQWNEIGKSITITILPPWWETIWFRLAMFLLLVIIVSLLFIYRVKSIRRQNKKLEQLVDKRTKQLSEKARELQEKNFVLTEHQEELLAASSELKEQSEALFQTNIDLKNANQTKTRLLSIIAHDIKNPFGVVMNFSTMLNEQFDFFDDTKKKKISKSIARSSESIFNMLDNLLNWARSQDNNIELKQERIDIVEVTEELIELHQMVFQAKALCVTVSADSSFIVEADINTIKTILRNAISNAVKFTPQGGTISFSITEQQQQVRMSVIDSGIGIPPEKLQSIFSIQSDKVQNGTEGERGTGLGLVVSKEFAEANGGSVDVCSEVGKGTEFTLLLPLIAVEKAKNTAIEKTHSQTEEESEITIPADKSKIVLVIDDNPNILFQIKELLGESYKLLEAKDGAEGVEKACSVVPDLIISDVSMPKKDGYTVLEELRANNTTNHIPLILLTARYSDYSRLRGYKKGADDYITKPFDKKILSLKVHNLLQRSRSFKQQQLKTKLLTSDKQQPAASNDDDFVETLKEYIEANITNNELSVELLAQSVSMSRTQLFRKVKGTIGITPVELIQKVKLSKALTLLKHGDKTVTEVAYESGYNSVHYFSKCFIKEYGEKPSEIRKNS